MLKYQPKGKVFDDGLTRYYVPSKHCWLTLDEIEEENRSQRSADNLYRYASLAVLVIALLYMLTSGFGTL